MIRARAVPLSAVPLTAVAALTEIAFISGVTTGLTIAATSFGTWNGDTIGTYNLANSGANKWGSTTIGTPGGTVTYYFDSISNWTPTEKTALSAGLAIWSAEANIQFAESATLDGASFTFHRGTDGGAFMSIPGAYATVGGSTLGADFTGGQISIDSSVPGFGAIGSSFVTHGGYSWQRWYTRRAICLGSDTAAPTTTM